VNPISFFRARLKGSSLSLELHKLGRMIVEEFKVTLRNRRFLAFVILMSIPVVVVYIVAGLFWLPSSHQNVELLTALSRGQNLLDLFFDDFEEVIKDLSGMAEGYWLGFPSIIVTAVLASEFVAGGRSDGTFDLFATKPVLRIWLVISKIVVFAISSFMVSLAIYLLLVMLIAFSFFSFSFTAFIATWKAGWLIWNFVGVTWVFIMAICGFSVLLSSFTKRSLFAVFGVLGYTLGYAIAVGLIGQIIPGGLGQVLSEKLSYIDVGTDARFFLSHLIYGENMPKTYLVEMDPNFAFVAIIFFTIGTLIAALINVEYKDIV
jgi:ABC-type transport system involved in multi-copper enzyme maturation permease subunit